MADAPPPRWSAPGFESAVEAALALAVRFAAGEAFGPDALPAGFLVAKRRPMRVVLTGVVEGPRGPVAVYAKLRRPVTLLDHARSKARSPRGAAEGRLLRALAAKGVAAAEPLGWAFDPATRADALLLRAVPDARPLADVMREPLPRLERAALAAGIGGLLRRAHDAGWRPRDVHRENVLVGVDGPVLVDPGTAPLRGPPLAAKRALLLGIAAHGLSPGPRAGLLALCAYAGGDRAEARRWMALAAEAERAVARAYRRGRSRRAHRTGLHFETFRPAGPASRGIVDRAKAPDAWRPLAASWIAAPPAGTRALKKGGGVLAVRLPGHGAEVAMKRYAPTWKDRFRTPRAIRAFRIAYALRVRGVACPEALLAASDARGGGVYVADLLGADGGTAIDLDRAAKGDGSGPSEFARLSTAARRAALERLGRFLRRMHDEEVVHRDLKAPNLVAWHGPRGAMFAVVDLEGAHVARGPVPFPRRARDLARLDASLSAPFVSRTDRVRVLRGYYATFARPKMPLAEFARRVAFASARKRAPSGRPR